MSRQWQLSAIGYAMLASSVAMLLVSLSACRPDTVISDIEVFPTRNPAVGQDITLSIAVTDAPAGQMRYVWSTSRNGKIEGDGPRRIFAPALHGADVVTCEVWAGGRLLATRSVTLEVQPQTHVLDKPTIPSAATALPPATIGPTSAEHAPSSTEAGGPSVVNTPRTGDEVVAQYDWSGYMGDGVDPPKNRFLQLDPAWRVGTRSDPCYKWTFNRGGPQGWAGCAMQSPPDNWGDQKGPDLTGYRRLTFWVRGEPGRSDTWQFKAGGHTKPNAAYRASFQTTTAMIKLTPEWKQYAFDMSREDLGNVAALLVVIVKAADNPDGAVLYLDDIALER